MAKYNAYLQKMIDETAAKIEAMNGFEAPQLAEPIRVHDFNHYANPWDPLYNDAEYAAKTRFGKIPAFPSFFEFICSSVHMPSLDPRGGFCFGMYAGENFELFKPMFPGETYKVFHKPSAMTDITELVKDMKQEYLDWPKEIPIFSWKEQDIQVFDSKDELVANFQHLGDLTIFDAQVDNVKKAEALPFKQHYYTEEEWEFIHSIMDGEIIRGALPRYWEDVNVGDKITPATVGPTTIFDMIGHFANCAVKDEKPATPLRYEREHNPAAFGHDPITNNYAHPIGMHLYDAERAKGGGMPHYFHFGNYGRNCLMRMITNWMGDDGDIRKFTWRHMKMTPTGDCLIAYGKVIDKRIENGEPIVEIDMWLENMCRGNISEGGRVTVKLPTKNGK